jgi:hypothetical protein
LPLKLPLDVDEAIQDEIRLRTQGADESVADYVTAVRTLMRRLSEVPPQSELRMLIKNLRPDIKLYITDCDVTNIVQLITVGKQCESSQRGREV